MENGLKIFTRRTKVLWWIQRLCMRNNSFKVMFFVTARRWLHLKIFWFHCWSSDFVCQTFCPGIFPWYNSWSCDFQESNGDKWLAKKPRPLRPLYFRTRHLMQVKEQCNAWSTDERFGKTNRIKVSSRVWQIECKNKCQNVLKRKWAGKNKMHKRQWVLRVCRSRVTFFMIDVYLEQLSKWFA